MIPDEVIIRAGTNMLAHTDMVPLEYVRQLEKDAERYKWLRESGKICASNYGVVGLPSGAWMWGEDDMAELDRSVDRAIAEQSTQQDQAQSRLNDVAAHGK